jgi:hypothetical protein
MNDDEDFDPVGECIHCGGGVPYTEWEAHEFSDTQIVCPLCDGPQTVDDVYPEV